SIACTCARDCRASSNGATSRRSCCRRRSTAACPRRIPAFSSPLRKAARSNNRYPVDLDQKIFVGQPLHHDQSVGRRVARVVLQPHFVERRARGDVGEIRRRHHQVREAAAGGFQHRRQVQI